MPGVLGAAQWHTHTHVHAQPSSHLCVRDWGCCEWRGQLVCKQQQAWNKQTLPLWDQHFKGQISENQSFEDGSSVCVKQQKLLDHKDFTTSHKPKFYLKKNSFSLPNICATKTRSSESEGVKDGGEEHLDSFGSFNPLNSNKVCLEIN